MQIEIQCNDLSGCNGYNILCKGKYLTKSGMKPRNFYEEDIELLLSENGYKKFEQGKFTFNIPSYKIYAITEDVSFYRPMDQNKLSQFQLKNNLI